MIPGINEVVGMFDVLRELSIVQHSVGVPSAATYAIVYGSDKVRIEESIGYEELIMSDEEADIIFICDNGVQAWLDRIEDTLLGVDGEDK